MDPSAKRPLGLVRLAGPTIWALGLLLVLIGVLIASNASPGEITPGSEWWGAGVAVGLLGAVWCLVISVVAGSELVGRGTDRRRAARTLLANAPPVLVTPLLVVLAAIG